MKRFDYEHGHAVHEIDVTNDFGESSSHSVSLPAYLVFDRLKGCENRIAACETRDDAERIVNALNAQQEPTMATYEEDYRKAPQFVEADTPPREKWPVPSYAAFHTELTDDDPVEDFDAEEDKTEYRSTMFWPGFLLGGVFVAFWCLVFVSGVAKL